MTMKKLTQIIIMLFVFTNGFVGLAQEDIEPEVEVLDKGYFQLNPRIGYDFPIFDNNTPYIDYKGGPDFGISLDYYWNWFGIGADFDYIMNKPSSTYPTDNLYEPDFVTPINSFDLSEEKITRLFYGIGPNLQYRTKNGKFKAELNTRVGFANIKGGRTLLEGTSEKSNTYPLNFHAGYKESNVLSAKGQMRFTYFLNEKFGINIGGYYMRHFGVNELNESGVSASYQPFKLSDGAIDQSITTIDRENITRSEPCDCDISSIGVFAGVTYKFTPNKKVETVEKTQQICPVCHEEHQPFCCETCGCGVTITAKDKFTGEILPHTDVVLKDMNGNVIQSGTTNSYGVVVFNDVIEDNYVISGQLYNVSLEDGNISEEEFKKCKKEKTGIQKVITYADNQFILKGNVVECNTDQGIQDVDIQLKDVSKVQEKHTLSDEKGQFNFHLKQISTYTLKGKKDGYYSNEVEVSTEEYNRNETLFIDFEMCVDPCGKAIKLDNINFDLDKSEILPKAIPDLERIVKLMKDNPNIKVEMSSHTDSQGSDAYNQRLSQRRADATVNYIVNQGISKDRLIARGAGETELKNEKCANNVPCTDDEHRINRRTEFKVICF